MEHRNPDSKWDAVVGVSGGKDSTAIVRRLIENHGIKNPLIINVTDEFTHTQAGEYNLHHLAEVYNLDTITLRCQPETFKRETRKDFFETLHPLKWIEQQLYEMPLKIAKDFGVNLVFMVKIRGLNMVEVRNLRFFILVVMKTQSLFF